MDEVPEGGSAYEDEAIGLESDVAVEIGRMDLTPGRVVPKARVAYIIMKG